MPLVSDFLEKRATVKGLGGLGASSLERWLIHGFTGGDTASGVDVDTDSALSATAIWAGVRLISESIASVPLNLYRRRDGPGKDIARDHALYTVLHDSPNPELTAMEFREMQMANLLLTGNSYAEIVTDGAGNVRELWPIWNHRVKVGRPRKGGPLVYEITTPGGGQEYLAAHQMHHVRGLSRGGLLGIDPVAMTREAIANALALERFHGAFFGSGSTPGGVLEHPGAMSEDAQKRFKVAWEEKHKGLSNAHRVAILEEGMQWKQMGVAPEQAQAIESRKFQLGEAARILRMPNHLLGDLEHATFSNIEHQGIEFVKFTLRPWAERLEQRHKKDLLTESERASLFTKHNLDGLMRGDMKSRFEAYAIGRQWGWYSANDILDLEDQNPIEGEAGSVYVLPLNMQSSELAGAMPESTDFPPEEDEEDEDERAEKRSSEVRSIKLRQRLQAAYRKVFEGVAQGVVDDEVAAVREAARKAFGERGEVEFRTWLDEFYADFGEAVSASFLRSLMDYAEVMHDAAASEVGGEPGLQPEDERFIHDYGEVVGKRWAGSSHGQLKKLLKDTEPEDIEAAIEARLAEWEAKRAGKSALRESNQAGNAITKLAYVAAGIASLRWRTVGDNCPLCARMNGRTVAIQGVFLEKGETLDPEVEGTAPLTTRSRIGHPPLHGGCDCTIVPGV